MFCLGVLRTVIYKHIQVKNISIEYCKKFPHQEANKTKNHSHENLHRFQRRPKRGHSAIMSDDELQYVKRQKVVHFGAIDGDSIETGDNDNIQVSNQYIAMDKERVGLEKISPHPRFI